MTASRKSRERERLLGAAVDHALEHGIGELSLRGLAAALHSGNPAFEPLPAYFRERLKPAFRTLLAAAAAAGEVRADVDPGDLLNAVANLSSTAHGGGPEQARRMVALLVDGLRYRART